jgi:hypothetical protein
MYSASRRVGKGMNATTSRKTVFTNRSARSAWATIENIAWWLTQITPIVRKLVP